MSTTTTPAEVQSNESANMNDSITSITSTTSSNSQNRFITEPILYKTKICRNFMRDGYCYYENKCMFAHGAFDVRNVDQNVKEGLTSEEKVKRFQTRSIIMLKQKTRKEQPPSFQDAVVQVAENVQPQPQVATRSNNNSMSPTTPPTQCASNAEHPATPPTKFSVAPTETSASKQYHGKSTPEPQGDALIDIFPADDESGNYQPQVISSTHNIHKYGYGSEPPSLNGSMSTSSMYSYGGPYSAPYGAQYSGYGYDYNTGYGTPQPGGYSTAPQQGAGYCECHSCHEAQRSMSQSLTSMHQSFTADDTIPSPSYYSNYAV